eukprot:COSAG06_NODE_3735_length_4963_cov_10.556538_6_plen_111_part_00
MKLGKKRGVSLSGEKRVLSITLGWHYPDRSYLKERCGSIAPFPLIFWLARACPGKLQSGCVRCRVGNHYTTLHKNSEDAARSLGSELESHVEAIAALHRYGTVLSLYPLN